MNFDDEWIETFEQKRKQSTQTLKVFYCYIDEDNIIQKINQDIIDVTNRILTKDEVIKLIIKNKRKHQLLNILTYIVSDIGNDTDYSTFFKSIRIEEIDLRKTSRIFESTNSVFFLFKKLKPSGTRKVYITSSRNTRRKGLKATTPKL